MTITTDVVIIGAGPVGLFQVFELGLHGISAHVIDALPQAGGQCTELYPDKPIYDIPAVPICTGQELTDLLLKQIEPFNPVFHHNETVSDITKNADSDFSITTDTGQQFNCKAIVVAAGAGSFTPVKVRQEGIDRFEDSQLFYRVRDPKQHYGKHLVILGGGDSAIDWALALADHAASIKLFNRTEKFRAAKASVDQLMALTERDNIEVMLGTLKDYKSEDGKLQQLLFQLRDEDKSQLWVDVDHLLAFFGLSPKLGPVENWGLELEQKAIAIDLATFETSVPGIYAVGDINTYKGKKKLILSGFHETAMAAHAILQQFEPDKKIHTQYTTTSPKLQARLGVSPKAS